MCPFAGLIRATLSDDPVTVGDVGGSGGHDGIAWIGPRCDDPRMHVLVVIGVLVLGGRFLSWWWHPLMRCRTCKGKQRNYGGIFRKNWNFCATCGGNGRAPRPGYKLLRTLGVLKHPAEETGPGWARKRRRAARLR